MKVNPDVQAAVGERYSRAAQQREAALCCPIEYDASYLAVIPQEILERDYGCGDPSRYVGTGDTVLDLGSGTGKICFIAAQIVGPSGRVIGVDMNDEMLSVARAGAPSVAESLGYSNVEFHQAEIQDLALDLDALETWLREHPVSGVADLRELEAERHRLRAEQPLVRDESVDVVISNCVLNLVRDEQKSQLIREIFRVLRPGGRIAIADIVSDAPVPPHLKADPTLWSGCISGAFECGRLLKEFGSVGFERIAIDRRQSEPFALIEGIEFRSVTITALKRGRDDTARVCSC